jgi:uncharacterized protein DUF4160
MPTAWRFGSLRVVIYPNDHRPAHVHVLGGGREAVFNLHCPDGPPALRESYRFSARELTAIVDDLQRALKHLCARWRVIHGYH